MLRPLPILWSPKPCRASQAESASTHYIQQVTGLSNIFRTQAIHHQSILQYHSSCSHVTLASCGAEHCDLSVAAGFEPDCPSNREEGVSDGHLMIPADCRSPASDRVHTEIPTTNGAMILSCSEDSLSLMMSRASREDISVKPEV